MRIKLSCKSLILISLFGLNTLVWFFVFSFKANTYLKVGFLDVGQGDSILVDLKNKNRILIDGGPDKKVLYSLADVLPPLSHYIDLIILTHAHRDHFEGLKQVLERYDVGAVILTDLDYQSASYQSFLKEVSEKKVKVIYAASPQSIHINDFDLDILWPREDYIKIKGDAEGFGQKSNVLNEISIVSKLYFKDLKLLLMGDATSKVEKELAGKFDLSAQVLKVGHHGSKYSSSSDFLKKVGSQAAIIEVGLNNRYGHPTPTALENLLASNVQIFRTDTDGNVKLISDGKVIRLYKGK